MKSKQGTGDFSWPVFTVLFCAFMFSACVQKMGKTGHLRPHEGNPALSLTSGAPPEGTVPQGGFIVDENPPRPPLTRELVLKGEILFEANCVPCHGPSGHGDGMVVQRGFLAPPSYHIDRLLKEPDQHFFDVITQGYGAMYSYADRVRPKDRWAIVAYIRALQLSERVKQKDLSKEDSEKWHAEATP